MSKKIIAKFNKITDKLCKGLIDLSKLADKKEGKEIINFTVKLLLAFIFILVLKIPVDLLIILVQSLLSSLPTVLNAYLLPGSSLLITYTYIVFSLLFVYYIIKPKTNKKDMVNAVVITKFLKFTKTTLTILNIPLILSSVVLVLVFAFLVALLFMGVYFISLFLMVISLFMVISSFSLLIYTTTRKVVKQ